MKNLELLISEDRLSTFKDEFSKFVKMSEKMNLPVPSYTVGEKQSKKVSFISKDTGGYVPSMSYLIDVFPVEINISETLKFNGWSLVATIHHREDIIDLVDVEYKLPEAYGCNFIVCEHCGHSHSNRVRSFVVYNEDTCKHKQVGSTCVHQFLGISPASLYKLNEQLVVLLDEQFGEGDDEPAGGWGYDRYSWLLKRKAYDIRDVFAVALKVLKNADFEYVKKEGYYDEYSHRYVRTNEGKATSELVEDIFDTEDSEWRIDEGHFIKVMQFISDMVPAEPNYGQEESFEQMVKSIDGATKIRRMDFWKVIWAILLQKRAEEESKRSNEFIGTVGLKYEVKCTIRDYKSGEGMYGTWELYIMEDEKGNAINKFGTINDKFITKAEGNKNSWAEAGDTVHAVAVIKSHDVKKERKITMLGRLSNVKK